MMGRVYQLMSGLGLTGILRDLACGALLAGGCIAVVPVVGLLMAQLRSAAHRGIARMAGPGAAFAAVNYFTFPGVMAHELAHALVARALGCRIDEMALFRPAGDSLGYVRFTCRGSRGRMSLQAAAASCAPVFMGFLLIKGIFLLASRLSGYWGASIVLYHAAFSVACHMTMSRQDLRSYGRGCVRLFLYLSLFGMAAFYIYAKMAARG